MDDLAPRIKELRTCHTNFSSRETVIGRIESNEPEELDPNEVMGYVNELEEVLGEKSFLQQKTFLRRFMKRMESNPEGVVLDYTILVPVDKNRTSTGEVLYIKQEGSPHWKHSELFFEKKEHIPAVQQLLVSTFPYQEQSEEQS